MASLNKVSLIGNVGKDPEIRSTQGGTEVASFSLAMTERWKDKSSGETKEKTEWARIVVWNEHLVKLVKNYVTKGQQLYLEGKLVTREFTNKEGNQQWTTEVVLENFNGTIVLLGKKAEGDGSSDRASQSSAPASSSSHQSNARVAETELDDEIPF